MHTSMIRSWSIWFKIDWRSSLLRLRNSNTGLLIYTRFFCLSRINGSWLKMGFFLDMASMGFLLLRWSLNSSSMPELQVLVVFIQSVREITWSNKGNYHWCTWNKEITTNAPRELSFAESIKAGSAIFSKSMAPKNDIFFIY